MVRALIMIDGETAVLAQDQDLEELQQRIEDAAETSGRFVEFAVVGNRTMKALVSGRMRVVFTEETARFDVRDTGDVDHPFGSHHDLL